MLDEQLLTTQLHLPLYIQSIGLKFADAMGILEKLSWLLRRVDKPSMIDQDARSVLHDGLRGDYGWAL